MSHGTHMNESWHRHTCVMAHMWMRNVTEMNESWHTQAWVTLLSNLENGKSSWLSRGKMRHVPYEWVMENTWMSHGTRTNESGHTHEWVILVSNWQQQLAVARTNATCLIWMSRVTRMNGSWHTYEWAMTHIWMSHGTHMNESWHTHEWIMTHTWLSHITQHLVAAVGWRVGTRDEVVHVAGNFLFTSQFHSPQKVELLQSFDGETIDVAVYFIYINIYACVYMYICIYVYIHICKKLNFYSHFTEKQYMLLFLLYIHIYIYVCIYVYMYIYIYTYM